MSSTIKFFLAKLFVIPKIIKQQRQWYDLTKDWSKKDWKNWVISEFDRLKKTPWTIKNYPELKDLDFEDLATLPLGIEYKEAPENFPAAMKFKSSGTRTPKIIKLSKNDLRKVLLAVGRTLKEILGDVQVERAMMMGFPGLASGRINKFVVNIIAKKGTFVHASRWREEKKIITKNAPYDFLLMPLPYTIDFFKHLDVDIFKDISFCYSGGDIMTDYIRELISRKGMEFNKIIYPADVYGISEIATGGLEVPPKVVKSMQYVPETNIMFLKKENGDVVNIFDAKTGDRGELYITPLFDYMVPHISTDDVIEIVRDETPFHLPALRVIGRKGIHVELELKTLGYIKGIYTILARVKGIDIDGNEIINLIGRKFMSESIILVEEKPDKVLMRIYTSVPVKLELLLDEFSRHSKLKYLNEDIENNLLEIEIIHDPEVIAEIKDVIYSKYGGQATLPWVIVQESEHN